jgi:hypothetical protein
MLRQWGERSFPGLRYVVTEKRKEPLAEREEFCVGKSQKIHPSEKDLKTQRNQ